MARGGIRQRRVSEDDGFLPEDEGFLPEQLEKDSVSLNEKGATREEQVGDRV